LRRRASKTRLGEGAVQPGAGVEIRALPRRLLEFAGDQLANVESGSVVFNIPTGPGLLTSVQSLPNSSATTPRLGVSRSPSQSIVVHKKRTGLPSPQRSPSALRRGRLQHPQASGLGNGTLTGDSGSVMIVATKTKSIEFEV
jgi:hypothetical protein